MLLYHRLVLLVVFHRFRFRKGNVRVYFESHVAPVGILGGCRAGDSRGLIGVPVWIWTPIEWFF